MSAATSDTSSRSSVAPRVVVARAPARLDFGGGWSDVPPYCDAMGGTVCNVAVARRATVRVAPADAALPPLDAPGRPGTDDRLVRAALRRAGLAPDAVRVDAVSDFPVAAGLGGSSALGVALAAALRAWRDDGANDGADDGAPDATTRDALAEWSRAVEVEEAGIAGGRQDHYAAAHGGALRLDFGAAAGGAPCRTTPIPLDEATRAALERRCVVVYTGESRISAATITGVLDAWRTGDRRVSDALARMAALAREMADVLARADVDALGALVGEHWTHQRALHPAIPTPRIDAIVAAAGAAGALGAKALGASGGGCVLAVAGEGREDAVRAAVTPLGEPVAIAVDTAGVTLDRG